MGTLIFLGAVSIDGYLARKDHSLDWLIGTEGEEEYDFAGFLESVDTLVMGRKTYEQLLVLSPDAFPYPNKKCFVFSRTLTGANEHVTFINDDIVAFTRGLAGRVWLLGGGEILQPLLPAVDEFFIQVAPVILGDGLPLFTPGVTERQLRLVGVKQIGQLAELHYVRG